MSYQTLALLAVSLSLGSAPTAAAAERTETTISVPGLHCAGCGKKIATQVNAVRGVAEVTTDVDAKTIKVTPKAGASLSPKALWEAVEKAKKAPVKLEGPSGTFTSKPTK